LAKKGIPFVVIKLMTEYGDGNSQNIIQLYDEKGMYLKALLGDYGSIHFGGY